MDPMRLRERFPGVDVTLDQSVYGGSSRASKKKRPPMAKSKTAPSLSVAAQSPLPPAVANVPKDDVQGYVHSKKVNNYLIGPTLGEGSFAKVKEAFHVLVGEKVAIKIIDKKKAQEDPYVAKNFKREAKLLQKLSHPNIVRLYEVVETEHNYYLVTELCTGGDLMKYIYKCGRLDEEETRKYIKQLVSAVDHLHKAGLIHRDLKVENLLLDHDKNLKLIDFGLSNEEYIRDQTGSEVHCRTQCGSPAYAAPELLGQKQYDQSVDIWSIGVNMYAMLTGMLPFTVEPFNITALHAKMLQNKMNPIPEHISQNCKDLLQKLLIASPEKRISMSDVFGHPWFHDSSSPPFCPAPYPNHITPDKINYDIMEHMGVFLDLLVTEPEIRHDLLANRATSSYAIYHLMEARLARYEREFPLKQRSKSDAIQRRMKLSKDAGFEDDDEDTVIPAVTTPSRLPTQEGSREKRTHGVPLRNNPSKQKSRPVSDLIPPTSNPYSGRERRRLSNILEERRGSAPPDVLAKQLEELKSRPTTQQHHARPTMTKNYTFDHGIEMSPPKEPYELDFNPPKKNDFSKKRHKSLPRGLDMQKMMQAWQSNPSSIASSRAGSHTNIHVPPLQKHASIGSNTSDEELEFHDVSSNKVTFYAGSPSQTPSPCKDNSHLLPPIKPSSVKKRKNGFSVPPLPLNGDYTIRTELQVSEIVVELLRAAQSMNMKSVEPLTSNKLHCQHKSVNFEVGVRKSSLSSCILHFEWTYGGNTRQFNDACHELLQRLTL